MRRAHVVDVLLKHSSNYKGERSKCKVVEGDVNVIEDGLAGKPTIKGKDELRNREQHIFVEEVKDHLRNTQVIPTSVYE